MSHLLKPYVSIGEYCVSSIEFRIDEISFIPAVLITNCGIKISILFAEMQWVGKISFPFVSTYGLQHVTCDGYYFRYSEVGISLSLKAFCIDLNSSYLSY